MGVSSDTKSKCAPNFFHSNARPENLVVASDMFVIIYSSLSLAFRPVVFVFPWLVNFLSLNCLEMHPGNEVVASGVFVIIYSLLSLAFPPVVLVLP